jgi:hypothetical protein
MSLELAKLEKVRELAGGIVQARCPACAEGGNDRAGVHLRIYPDGRFGCCVYPKDGEHRKRIFALAGVRGKLPFLAPGNYKLRVQTPSALPAGQSIKADLAARTPRTAITDLVSPVPSVPSSPVDDSRTPRTANLKSRACAREESSTANICREDFQERLEDLKSAVRAVRISPIAVVAGERLPFLTAGGDLSIPFDSPERYHWWRGGQSVAQTLIEVQERMKNAITI